MTCRGISTTFRKTLYFSTKGGRPAFRLLCRPSPALSLHQLRCTIRHSSDPWACVRPIFAYPSDGDSAPRFVRHGNGINQLVPMTLACGKKVLQLEMPRGDTGTLEICMRILVACSCFAVSRAHWETPGTAIGCLQIAAPMLL